MMVQAVVAIVMLLMSVAVAVADAAAVVDVYRVIQFDLQNAPMGSRLAALNHHATSGLVVLGPDLSRAVVVLSVLPCQFHFSQR